MYKYIHKDFSLSTIKELVESPTSLFRGINQLVLIGVEYDGKTNLQRIYESYPASEYGTTENEKKYNEDKLLLETYSEDYNSYSYTNGVSLEINLQKIQPLTEIYVPEDLLNRDVLPFEGDLLFSNDYKEFLSREIDRIRQNLGTETILQTIGGKNIIECYLKVTVWVWSKSKCLGRLRTENHDVKFDYENYLIDITPFVISLRSTVDKNGGGFDLELAPLLGVWDNSKKKWVRDKNMLFSNGEFIYNTNLLRDKYRKNLKEPIISQENLYFNEVLSENDIVFIRFDALGSESTSRIREEYKEEIPLSEIPNKLYDMIGLIDRTTVSVNPQSNDLRISVSGRDLTKLLVEDNCYFSPVEFIQGEGGIYANIRQGKMLQRYSGKIQGLAQSSIKTIGFSLKFVFNALSNIGICPDGVFNPYSSSKTYTRTPSKPTSETGSMGPIKVDYKTSDRRTHRFKLDIEDKINKSKEWDELDKIFEKIKNYVGDSRIVDDLAEDISDIEKTRIKTISGDLVKFMHSCDDDLYQPGVSKFKDTVPGGDIDWWIFGWSTPIYNEEEMVEESHLSKIFVDSLCKGVFEYYWKGQLISNAQAQKIIDEINILMGQIRTAKNAIQDLKQTGSSTKIIDPNDNDGTNVGKFCARGVYWDQVTLQKFSDALWSDINANTGSYVGNVQDQIGKVADKTRQDNMKTQYNLIFRTQDRLKEIQKDLSKKLVSPNINDINTNARRALNSAYEYMKKLKEIENRKDIYTLEVCNGIWQIIKLIVDDKTDISLANRRIVDSSLGNETGSLHDQITKICKPPFVEMFGDTYYDQFYFIVRQPPFDYKRVVEMAQYAISIGADQVESYNFGYENTVYSWYRIIPKGYFSGKNNEMVWAVIKAVLFPEFAEIWGDKPLEITTNYI
ncbi:MAG TPA: hypothetical protein PKY56_02570, partial [Candidatus Kapabacteria bacterium]|nr:hypothetical protein [Candidatus Kapabacteria bacterium]